MVQPGKLLGNGQAQAGGVMFGLCGGMKVSVKDRFLILRCNAVPGILYTDQSIACVFSAGHLDTAADRGVMDGVGHEILHHLLQPDLIPPDRQRSGRLCVQCDAFFLCLGLTGGAYGSGGLIQKHLIFIEQKLFLFQLCGQKKILGQAAHKIHPLLQGGQQGGQGLRCPGQGVQAAAYCKQWAAQVVEDIQHHAFACFGLLGQGLGALGHPQIQFPGQLFCAVKLQRKPPAYKDQASQRKRKIKESGAADQVKTPGLYKKIGLQPRQQGPYPQPRCDGTRHQEQPCTFYLLFLRLAQKCHTIEHTGGQGGKTYHSPGG